MFATWWIICFGAFKSYQWKQYVIRCTRVARPLWLFDVGDWFRFIFCTFIRFVIVNEYRIAIKQKAFIRISLGDSSSQRFTKFYSFFCWGHRMSIKRSQMPVKISEPDPESKFIEDRLHWAILRGKTVTVSKLLDSGENWKLGYYYLRIFFSN
jgi:hypothetical protein